MNQRSRKQSISNLKSGLNLYTISLHHKPIKLPQPVVSFIEGKVHERDTKLSLLMTAVHDLNHQDTIFQEIKPGPNVLD